MEHDTEKLYYIYCSQGRIGSNRGARKTIHYGGQLDTAIDEFRKLFHQLTGNYWDNRSSFVKKGGKMELIDVQLNGLVSFLTINHGLKLIFLVIDKSFEI